MTPHVMFRHVRSAQDSARWWRRAADQYVDLPGYDKWRSRCLREANRRYRDALFYMRLIRPSRLEHRHE